MSQICFERGGGSPHLVILVCFILVVGTFGATALARMPLARAACVAIVGALLFCFVLELPSLSVSRLLLSKSTKSFKLTLMSSCMSLMLVSINVATVARSAVVVVARFAMVSTVSCCRPESSAVCKDALLTAWYPAPCDVCCDLRSS